jgi:hypothetical protein
LKLRRLSAERARLVHVARHVGREFAHVIGRAAGFARLVVVAELDQHIGLAEGGAVAQQLQDFVPAPFGAKAGRAAAAARQVQAGRLRREAGAQGVAVAGGAGHGGVADQDHAVGQGRGMGVGGEQQGEETGKGTRHEGLQKGSPDSILA